MEVKKILKDSSTVPLPICAFLFYSSFRSFLVLPSLCLSFLYFSFHLFVLSLFLLSFFLSVLPSQCSLFIFPSSLVFFLVPNVKPNSCSSWVIFPVPLSLISFCVLQPSSTSSCTKASLRWTATLWVPVREPAGRQTYWVTTAWTSAWAVTSPTWKPRRRFGAENNFHYTIKIFWNAFGLRNGLIKDIDTVLVSYK